MIFPQYRHRIPTGDEWEHMARGSVDHHSKFFENDSTFTLLYANFLSSGPQQVASLRPNRLGLYDMLGNVWQWTDEGSGGVFNTRGGSYGRRADLNARESRHSNEFAPWIGLRVARSRLR